MADAATSAGWIGVTAGLVGGAITIAAGFFLEDYKRHRDRQAVAMAFLGEIKTLVDLSKRLNLAGEAKRVADVLRPLAALPPGFGTSQKFSVPNPVFEKAADKIGVFSGEMPMWISEFYNYVIGLRLAYFDAVSNGPAGVQRRVATLDYVSAKLPEMIDLADLKIIPGLQAVASLWWWPVEWPKAMRKRWRRGFGPNFRNR